MGKFLVFCIIALTVLMVVPAYAEVQNVKVSGDLSARWIIRSTYDLDKNNVSSAGNAGDDMLMSTAEVEVDADLTDNVSTVIRLANQRDWGEPQSQRINANTDVYDVVVDLANVTLKELVYSPLTVTIGRQDLWFGKGFIVGARQRDPHASIGAKEYTVINSFDAIKATLDFDPWKIDGVYALLEEGTTARNDDIWMVGANVGYKFDSYKGEAEGYLWRKYDRSKIAYISGSTTAACERNSINVMGLRGSLEPIANASLSGEFAWQGGYYSTFAGESRRRNAMALDIAGDYNFKDVKWTPNLALEYIYYSGESKNQTSSLGQGNKWNAWDPFYRGKFDSAIREFQNVYYATAMREANVTTQAQDMDAGSTNEHQVLLTGTIRPTNSLLVAAKWGWFRLAEALTVSGSGDRSKDLGNELDVSLTYDYTEDVSFNLLAGWFFPGKYWISGQDDTATDLVGTVKVAF